MKSIRLTAAQAMVRYLARQMNEDGVPFLGGAWAIFGHGNVAGIGEALHAAGDEFPTWRAHNEQGMAHAAIAYAKALNRKRAMAVTTSIGPGALNMVTAAAMAHVNRLPVLLIPGTSSPAARPTRCCSRSRTSATAPPRPTMPSARSAATSIASCAPSSS